MKWKRFWYGHLDDRNGGTIVIWDRKLPTTSHDHVRLYHARRKQVLEYNKNLVKQKLRPLSNEEFSVIDGVISEYIAIAKNIIKNYEERYKTAPTSTHEIIEQLHSEINITSDPNEKRDLQQQLYRIQLDEEGENCEECSGSGFIAGYLGLITCRTCLGWGRVPKW